MKYSLLFLLFISGISYGQNLNIVSNDTLAGSYQSFAYDGENYYALTQFGIYFKFDLNGNVYSKTELDCGSICNIYEIAPGPDGKLYFATRSGVYVEEPDGSFNHLFALNTASIAFGLEGEIYFADKDGSPHAIGIYVDGEITSFNSDNSIIENMQIKDVKVDSEGTPWFGGFDGLYKYSNGELTLVYNRPINHIHIDSDDKIYLTRQNESLVIYDPVSDSSSQINWMSAVGKYFSSNSSGSMFALDNGEIHFHNGAGWTSKEFDTFGLPNNRPSAGFMDPHGNYLVSLEGVSEILVFDNMPVSTSNIEIDFKISPNPTSDYLEVLSKHPVDEISIQNLQGQVVLTEKVNAASFTVDLNRMVPGTYFVVLTAKNHIGRKKIIIH